MIATPTMAVRTVTTEVIKDSDIQKPPKFPSDGSVPAPIVPPVTGATAAPMMLEKDFPAAPRTLAVSEFFDTTTATMATPIMAVKTTITEVIALSPMR